MQTRWNVAVTMRTTATTDEINHLTTMLSMQAGEITELNGRLVIKATTDYEVTSADAIRTVMYPIETWLRCFSKLVNFFHVEADAIDDRSALTPRGYAPGVESFLDRWADPAMQGRAV